MGFICQVYPRRLRDQLWRFFEHTKSAKEVLRSIIEELKLYVVVERAS